MLDEAVMRAHQRRDAFAVFANEISGRRQLERALSGSSEETLSCSNNSLVRQLSSRTLSDLPQFVPSWFRSSSVPWFNSPAWLRPIYVARTDG